MEIERIIRNVKDQLDWRSPNGCGHDFVVLDRDEIGMLIKHFEKLEETITNHQYKIDAKDNLINMQADEICNLKNEKRGRNL